MSEGSRREFMDLLATQDEVPAFIHRAQNVALAKQRIVTPCAAKYREFLDSGRLRLAQLHAIVGGEWNRLVAAGVVSADYANYLHQLHTAWQPELRIPLPATQSPAKLRRALADVAAAFRRFNDKWQRCVAAIDFDDVNKARDGYNQYYVVEKACAFGSERIASIGFQKLPPMTPAEVQLELPLLRLPSE